MTLARTVERQADALRMALGALAGGQGDVDTVRRLVAALRWQLERVERVADGMAGSSPTQRTDAGG